ncbi:TAXI family TRAP transporter solute-binding subunit [Gymnodinialimonas sp.]
MNSFLKLAAVAALAVTAAHTAQAQDELRIGTASLGGAYYPMGQALSNNINNFAEGYTMLPIVTGGGAENPRLVAAGEVEVAIAPASLGFFAHEGRGPYPDPLPIRAIGTLHSSVLHMVTLPGSGIEGIEDLAGRRVAVGPAGGGTLNLMRDIFAIHDMTMEDITPSFLSYADGFSQLADGSVDASFALAGFPTSAVVQAGATNELRFIELSDEMMATLLENYPYYSNVSVPEDAYGTDAPITVVGSANMLITHADMDEELAHTIAEAVYGNLDALVAENALASGIVAERSLNLPIPLHPGAARYFGQ